MTAGKSPYGSQWRRARDAYLAQHPLCVMCKEQRRVVPASVVDHVIPHKGDATLFWSPDNWQALCQTHHNSTKQAAERADQSGKGCDAMGRPLDPARRAAWEAR